MDQGHVDRFQQPVNREAHRRMTLVSSTIVPGLGKRKEGCNDQAESVEKRGPFVIGRPPIGC